MSSQWFAQTGFGGRQAHHASLQDTKKKPSTMMSMVGRGEEENAKNTFLRVRPYGASRSNLYLTIIEINPTFSSSVRSPGSSRT